MVRQGHQLLSAALELADDVRQCITEIRGPHVLHEELVGAEASHDLDPLKVIIDLTGLGTPRYQTADWLHAHRAIDTDCPTTDASRRS